MLASAALFSFGFVALAVSLWLDAHGRRLYSTIAALFGVVLILAGVYSVGWQYGGFGPTVPGYAP